MIELKTIPLDGSLVTTDDALAYFDSLEPVSLDFMLGKWKGGEIPTNHPMDGLLEATNWYGKEFVSQDEVFPLVLSNRPGETYKIVPYGSLINLGMKFPVFKSLAMKKVNGLVTKLVQTKNSQARIRMTELRGKISATMIYDGLPINDVFRKINDNVVMGLMDYKGKERPYFFYLEREEENE
ncbi:MAG: DUF4334 domain-containing protein [Chloroflexota bacterium]